MLIHRLFSSENRRCFFGARGQQAGRRYAAPLAGLLGPAAACGGLGLALRATAAQRWAAHRFY